jgi:hypothetical protein
MHTPVTSADREERFLHAPAHIQTLYESNGWFLRQVFSVYGFPEEKYRDFAILIGDVILGLTSQDKLTPLLMMHLSIDHDKAERVVRSMGKYLEQIETGVIVQEPIPVIPGADPDTREALTLKPRMTEKIVERQVPEPGTRPLTREELLRSLSAKRTLASDISALDHTGETPQQ